jgi:murein DD-endopeptidase MepM/ murein hydrolase activator NlpD
VVASGESLYVIARKYGVEPKTIVTANNLGSMDKLFVGQKLVIPGGRLKTDATTTASVTTPTPPKTPATTPSTVTPVAVASTTPATATTTEAPVRPAAADGKFRWPVSGTVIVDFASSRSGINIAAQEGTAVRAAEGGTVIYTGSAVQGYGNLVLIKHENGYVSAYAHLKDITVAKGEAVNRGDAIGSAGMTGGVSRPQLHFELRKGATPVDPMPLLAG